VVPATPGPRARQHYNVTLAVLALGGIAYALLQSLVAPALTDIQHELHCSESAVAWVLTGYLLSASVATPIVGRLGDTARSGC
jgi:predicted MFS family arabinose efflux permease